MPLTHTNPHVSLPRVWLWSCGCVWLGGLPGQPQTQYFPTSVPAHYTAAAEAARAALGDKPILPPLLPVHARQQCLVLDLDETLVHSSFRPVGSHPAFPLARLPCRALSCVPAWCPVGVTSLCLRSHLTHPALCSTCRTKVANPDYIIPVQIEDVVHHVYVCKRPGVDSFLIEVAKRFEIVIYTASLNKCVTCTPFPLPRFLS